MTRPLKTIYLCGPINGTSDAEANGWRAEVKDKLAGFYTFIDPMRHDYRGRESGKAEHIVGDDMQDLYTADVIFANCWKPSVGTSMEIVLAFELMKKPVIVVAPEPMSPWLIRFSTAQYYTLMGGITYARTIAKK